MSVLTRLTHHSAKLLLSPQRYVTALPGTSESGKPAVYLTFDDGPHADRTNRILDHFAEFGGKGTFFAIGRRARRYPNTLRRILEEGHSVGCHTWRHWSSRRLSSREYLEDVRRSRDEIEQITGHIIDLFRPPYGELTPMTLLKLMLDGFRIVHWTHDTRDFELPTVPHLQRRFDKEPLVDGAVVLLHDDRCVTSFGLGDCLRAWGSGVEFRAISMPLRPPVRSSAASPPRKYPVLFVPSETEPVGAGSKSEEWALL